MPECYDFGRAVAISGDTIIVGAYNEDSCSTSVSTTAATDNGCANAGAVYVFVRSGALWSGQSYLKAQNAGADDEFGWAVAISGDTIVVGAQSKDSCSTSISTTAATDNACSNAGAVYVYVRSGTVWSVQMFLKAPNAGTVWVWRQLWVRGGDLGRYDHCRRVLESSCSTSIAPITPPAARRRVPQCRSGLRICATLRRRLLCRRLTRCRLLHPHTRHRPTNSLVPPNLQQLLRGRAAAAFWPSRFARRAPRAPMRHSMVRPCARRVLLAADSR